MLYGKFGTRNGFIFSIPDRSPENLAQRAISFIHGHREVKLPHSPQPCNQLGKWTPPNSGLWKLNFDAGKLGDWGWGLGFVIRDSFADVVIAGSHQSVGFPGPEVAKQKLVCSDYIRPSTLDALD